MTYKIWVWQLGDIFVVGVPGEPYTELQVMIREAVPEKHVIVSVNTNGVACFLPRTIICTWLDQA